LNFSGVFPYFLLKNLPENWHCWTKENVVPPTGGFTIPLIFRLLHHAFTSTYRASTLFYCEPVCRALEWCISKRTKRDHSPYNVSNINIYTDKNREQRERMVLKITFVLEKQTKQRSGTIHEQKEEEECIQAWRDREEERETVARTLVIANIYIFVFLCLWYQYFVDRSIKVLPIIFFDASKTYHCAWLPISHFDEKYR